MNWLKQKIRNWLSNDDHLHGRLKETVVSNRESPRNEGLNFFLYKAVGGHVFESRKYNERTDRHENTLYMIHEDEDFAKQVAQAIMLEQMKL